MTKEQIILAALSLILIPAAIAEVRHRIRVAAWMTQMQEWRTFIQAYLLKNAVLEFHNNPNPETDKIIEKINDGEAVTQTEMEQLHKKLEGIAKNAPDTRKQLKAQNTLDLMEKIFEWDTSISERNKARNELFNA